MLSKIFLTIIILFTDRRYWFYSVRFVDYFFFFSQKFKARGNMLGKSEKKIIQSHIGHVNKIVRKPSECFFFFFS